MTTPDLIAELADKWNAKASELYNCQMHDAASVYETCADELRTHHAEIADMAKRLEAAERDAARYRWLLNQSVRIEARAWVWEPNEPEMMHPDERFDATTQEGEG